MSRPYYSFSITEKVCLSLPPRPSVRLRNLSGTLPRGMWCLPASATHCLPPGFQGPVGRAFPGWSLVQTHRNASSPGRERQLSPTPQLRGLALAKDIPSPCFLLCLNKHRICPGGQGEEGPGDHARGPCSQFTQHPPALWLQTASS